MKPLDFFQNRTFIESSISLLYCMITNWIILNNFQVNTCPIDRKAFKAIIIYNRLGGNEISREAIKEKISTNDENVVYDDTTLCEICGCGDRGESLLLCDGTVQFITSVCAKICKKIFWSDPIYSFFILLIFVCFFLQSPFAKYLINKALQKFKKTSKGIFWSLITKIQNVIWNLSDLWNVFYTSRSCYICKKAINISQDNFFE